MVAKKSVYRAVMTVLDTASPGAASRFFPSSPSSLWMVVSSLFLMVLGTRLVVTECMCCMWKPPGRAEVPPTAVLLAFPCRGSGRRQTEQWCLIQHTVQATRTPLGWAHIDLHSQHVVLCLPSHVSVCGVRTCANKRPSLRRSMPWRRVRWHSTQASWSSRTALPTPSLCFSRRWKTSCCLRRWTCWYPSGWGPACW